MTETQPGQTDAVALLTNDHRTVEQLFTQLEGLQSGVDRREELIQQVVSELSVHAVIEEQVLYPAIRSEVPGGEELADHAIDEHQRVKELLARLEELDPKESETDQVLRQLMADFRQHVQEEEGPDGLFDQLRTNVDQGRLVEMGDAMSKAKTAAPTHPHPRAPSKPPGNVVAGAVASVVDKARDALRRK